MLPSNPKTSVGNNRPLDLVVSTDFSVTFTFGRAVSDLREDWAIGKTRQPIARANFPIVISAGVARVTVFDRELGNVPDFSNFVSLPETTQNQISEVVPKVTEKNNQEENEKTQLQIRR
jgi:hypothetical protein